MLEVYQKMYAILCGAISEALDSLPFTADNLKIKLLLEKALQDAEDLYIENSEGK